MYKVDVTAFRQADSEEGFPLTEHDDARAWEMFDQAIADLYLNPNKTGSYTVVIYLVGTRGEVPLRQELVNVPRKRG